ncbi:glycoside hydrolase family 65 protein [Candidatus Enterococcus ferrettii]|uniref:Alpha,alpha-trehalose phosphorylase n=1 Tax=Candidatus Enterococcus ferrettii TaxID=2815324 RepID=A0ABV0EUL5_9ENTE|nr:glycoside hydrolase family 65 protein [Enterococcus sp. 665A]MBO1339357.1 glycoside hydrolase family 65 protein [Enterococcus sp. 665A]
MKIFLNEYDQETLEKAESLFFNGNGSIGLRGNLEEAYYEQFATNRETYMNGFYETKDIHYPEKMFGFTPTGETMISVIDGQTTLITIGGEPFSIERGEVSQSVRYLDMEKGLTVRELLWSSPKGLKTKIKISRLASFIHKNLFSMKIDFDRLNHNEPIELTTQLNFYPIRTIDKNDPRMSHDFQTIQIGKIDLAERTCRFRTKQSHLTAELKWSITGKLEQTIEAERITVYSTLEGNSYQKNLSYKFRTENHSGIEKSFDELAALQEDYLKEFWRTAKVEIDSQEKLEESVNYSTFALLQSLGTDGKSSIAAKGLSGSGYEGHVFWDAEMYVFPVFLHLKPKLAKALLEFRYHTLGKAKENRELYGYRTGALYPWRTISGTESSPFFEGGSAQHHINADIAYAFISYYRYTDDLSFMIDCGFEVMVETARIFAEIGYIKNHQFHIDKITGPDEYTVLVNDNYYTNKLVAYQFEWIARLREIIQKSDPNAWQELAKKLYLEEEEISDFQIFAEIMALPYEKELGIIAQDRDFLNKSKWPYSPEETHYPLLLNYHPLTIYRYQIAKQADAVLALMLFQDQLDQETIRKSVAYYDHVTTHDSSLSYSIFSTVYSRLGSTKKGYQYLLENARTDLDNSHKNTKDGIHTASMGGTFMALVYGFCNLQIINDKLVLDPNLPKEIRSICFVTQFKGQSYRIFVDHHVYEITPL